MPIIANRSTLTGLFVREAYRKQVVRLQPDESIGTGIDHLHKHKVNTLLVVDVDQNPLGVVSRTDIMGAYYANLPVTSPLEYIMVQPVLFCSPDEYLESALDKMRAHKIHALYVKTAEHDLITGILTYADIVGLLYMYCHKCKLSTRNGGNGETGNSIDRFTAGEIMSHEVVSLDHESSLADIMEVLSAYRFGGVLITENNTPCGTISKTDLIASYRKDIPPEAKAQSIMSQETFSCSETDLLESAIQKMITAEVQRLFVYRDKPDNICGVLSLSDTARYRSGSCHACMTARIQVEKYE